MTSHNFPQHAAHKHTRTQRLICCRFVSVRFASSNKIAILTFCTVYNISELKAAARRRSHNNRRNTQTHAEQWAKLVFQIKPSKRHTQNNTLRGGNTKLYTTVSRATQHWTEPRAPLAPTRTIAHTQTPPFRRRRCRRLRRRRRCLWVSTTSYLVCARNCVSVCVRSLAV